MTPATGRTYPKQYPEISMTQFLFNHLSRLRHDEAGQGLVEYLLIMALVAFGAVAGMDSLATGLNSAFAQISAIMGGYIT
jgi:Flp pilus assembly pilin Flp